MRNPYYWRGGRERIQFATKITYQNGKGPEIVEGFGNNLLQISENGNSLNAIKRIDLFIKENGHKNKTATDSPTIVYQALPETEV